MAKTKKGSKASASRKAAVEQRAPRAAASSSAMTRATRRSGSLPNAEYLGRSITQYFEQGVKGTKAAGWYKGTIIDVLSNGNFRIEYQDSARHAFPKEEVMRMIEEKSFKLL